MEIHPETPILGMDINQKFGERTVEVTINRLNQMGQAYGLTYGKLTHLPNSNFALQAAEYARSKGKIEAYHHLLMESYFTHGKDIGRIDVLCELGRQVGLNATELEEAIVHKLFQEKLDQDAEIARKNNIHSTPTFIINDQYLITGAQSIDKFRQAFNEILES